jgi:hypothetical protein
MRDSKRSYLEVRAVHAGDWRGRRAHARPRSRKLKPSDRTHPGVQLALERLIKDDSAEVRERAEAALRKKDEG